MPAACTVSRLQQTSCGALGNSLGFPGPRFLAVVKGGGGSSLQRGGAGEIGVLQGRWDGATGFLRFVLQGQSNRQLGLAWIQKWKLFYVKTVSGN